MVLQYYLHHHCILKELEEVEIPQFVDTEELYPSIRNRSFISLKNTSFLWLEFDYNITPRKVKEPFNSKKNILKSNSLISLDRQT